MKKETENFIQLLIWIIANEITKDQGSKDDRNKVFRGIRNLLSKKYSIHGDSDEPDDGPDHESIEFAAEIINLYYNRFAERTDDGDDNGALKLISEKEFRLMNGKCDKEFKKLTIIGHGTFGNVYRAVNALDNEKYAIKKVSLYEERRDKILREVHIWAKMSQSPFIVQYKSSWTENHNIIFDRINKAMNDGAGCESASDSKSVSDESPLSGYVLYIQMELCRMTLKNAITKIHGELNHSNDKQINIIGAFIATQFFHEIVNGVQFLHSLSSSPIIHRDLKPENIYVTDGKGGNFIKIGDFGTAKFYNQPNDTFMPYNITHKTEHSQEHTLKQGTVKYMAPEVFESLNYDQKCDIYSLGCIGLDLLCIKWDTAFIRDLESFSTYIGNPRDKRVDCNCFLRKLRDMTSLNPTKRPSANTIIEDRDQWLIEIKDFDSDPLLYSIVVSDDKIDKITQNPLSHYILWKYLMIEKERELQLSKRGIFNSTQNWIRFRFSMEDYNKFSDGIRLEKFTINSNLDEPMQRQIIGIAKQAFTVHMSHELICDFIEKNVQNTYLFGYWKCVIHETEHNHQLHVINWENRPYLHLYLIPDEGYTQLKGMKLFIYNIPNDAGAADAVDGNESLNNDSKELKIIMNSYDSAITEELITFMDDTQKSNNFTEIVENLSNVIDADLMGFPIEHCHNLLKLTSIVSDETAFYYFSKDRDFLFYSSHITICECEMHKSLHYGQFNGSINCKFSATIGKLRFAIFTSLKQCENKLRISFTKSNKEISEMRISKRRMTR